MQKNFNQLIDKALIAVGSLGEKEGITFLEKCSELLVHTFVNEKKVLIAGNGGSMCDALHFAEEFTGVFRKKRRALPAIALGEAGHMSCVSNDIGFDEVFARGVEAFGQKGDVLILLTTSGNSKNLLRALEVAKEKHVTTVALLGRGGGLMKGLSDIEWIVPHVETTDRIQEAHMTALHMIIEAVENQMFPEKVSCSQKMTV